jgi:molybdenum cofactor biosynthesis protein B
MTYTLYINERGEKIILKKNHFIIKYKYNENLPDISSYTNKYKLLENKKNVIRVVSEETSTYGKIDYFKGKINLKYTKIHFFAYYFSSSNKSPLFEANAPKEKDVSKYSFCIQSRFCKKFTLKEKCELAKKVKAEYIKKKKDKMKLQCNEIVSNKATLQDLPINVSTRRPNNMKIRDNVGIICASDSGKIDGIKLATDLLEEAGFKVTSVVSINNIDIEETLKNMLLNQNVNIIICIGGTGISKTDTTIEVVKSIFQKELDGFGELFRYLTYKKWKHLIKDIGILSIDTRTTAGVANNKLIFAIPGSPDATEFAIKEIIIPSAPTLLGQLQKEK